MGKIDLDITFKKQYKIMATLKYGKKSSSSRSQFRKNRSHPIRKKTYSCENGRRKSQCKDCGTGHCKHKRLKGRCKDCGTDYCEHGKWKSSCKDCGTVDMEETNLNVET